MRRQVHRLDCIAAERIREELTGLLCGRYVQRTLMAYADLITSALPELAPMQGCQQQNPHHLYDVWEHTVRAVGQVPAEPVLRWAMLLHTCGNGSSEMVSNIANALTTFLFNIIFLRFWGEDGVASITIAMYFQFVFTAVFFGFSMGVAPVISYKYGAEDTGQLRRIVRICLCVILACSLGAYLLARLLIGPSLILFTDPGTPVYEITMEGFPLYAASFLVMGISIFASSLFTAFSNGLVSAVISFARTFVFLVGMLLIMPQLLGRTGIWLAVPAAEVLGLLVSAVFLLWGRKKYQYA